MSHCCSTYYLARKYRCSIPILPCDYNFSQFLIVSCFMLKKVEVFHAKNGISACALQSLYYILLFFYNVRSKFEGNSFILLRRMGITTKQPLFKQFCQKLIYYHVFIISASSFNNAFFEDQGITMKKYLKINCEMSLL